MSYPVRSLLVFGLLAALGCSRSAEKLFEVSTDGSTRTPMLAANDAVVVANEAGFLTRISAEGGVLWKVPTPQPIDSRPVEARGMVVATNVAGDWFGALVSNGKVPWRLPRQPLTRGDLLTDGGRVYAVLADGSVRAIDPTSGAILWTKAPPAGAKAPSASGVRVGPNIAVALGDAGIVALSWQDGATAWRANVNAVALTASADGSRLYAATQSGALVALNGASGEQVWTQPLEGVATTRPTLVDSRVYIGVDKVLRAFDATTGEPRETIALDEPVAAPVRTPDVLVVPTAGQQGRVHLFKPGSLTPYDSIRLDSPVRQAPLILNGTLILLTSDGRVLGYRLKPPKK